MQPPEPLPHLEAHYAMGPWHVLSEVPLSPLPYAAPDGGVDITIRFGPVPARSGNERYTSPLLQVDATGTCRYHVPGVATYQVDAGQVTVATTLPLEAPDVRVFLLGHVFALLVHQRGLLPVHAASVVIDGRAWLLGGSAASGKSTWAAACGRLGHRVLSDDVSVIQVDERGQPHVVPLAPVVRLWRDARHALGLEGAVIARGRHGFDRAEVAVGPFGSDPRPMLCAGFCQLGRVVDPRRTREDLLASTATLASILDAVVCRPAAAHLDTRRAMMTTVLQVARLPCIRHAYLADLPGLTAAVERLVDRLRGVA